MSESSGEFPAQGESKFDRLSTNLVALAADPKRFIGASSNTNSQEVLKVLENREQILEAVAARYAPGPGVRYDLAEGFTKVSKKLREDVQKGDLRLGGRGVVQGDVDLINGVVTLIKGVSNPYELFGTVPFATPFELQKASENTVKSFEGLLRLNNQPETVKMAARTLLEFVDNMNREAMEVYREVASDERQRIARMGSKEKQRDTIERYFNNHLIEERARLAPVKR